MRMSIDEKSAAGVLVTCLAIVSCAFGFAAVSAGLSLVALIFVALTAGLVGLVVFIWEQEPTP